MCYYFRSRTLPWAPAPWPPCLFSSRDGNHRWRWVEITCKFILPPSIFIFSRHLKYHFSAILSFNIFPPFSVSKFSRYLQFQNFPTKSCYVPNCLCCEGGGREAAGPRRHRLRYLQRHGLRQQCRPCRHQGQRPRE